MTKKHFEAIARMVRELLVKFDDKKTKSDYTDGFNVGWSTGIEALADDLADYFAAQNERFDRERFLTACGLGE